MSCMWSAPDGTHRRRRFSRCWGGRSTWRCWLIPARLGSRCLARTRTWSWGTGCCRAGPRWRYRENHEELSLRSQGQSYILRASWFRYVDEELGREVLLDLAAGREGWDREAVETVLGASLEQVDADWEAWAMARYDAVPDADAKAEAYRTQKMAWYEPCLE